MKKFVTLTHSANKYHSNEKILLPIAIDVSVITYIIDCRGVINSDDPNITKIISGDDARYVTEPFEEVMKKIAAAEYMIAKENV